MDMKRQEKILKALANLNRLKMLAYLQAHVDVPVGSIAKHCRLSLKSTSKHLALLYQADILDRSRRTNEICYRISDNLHPIVKTALQQLAK